MLLLVGGGTSVFSRTYVQFQDCMSQGVMLICLVILAAVCTMLQEADVGNCNW